MPDLEERLRFLEALSSHQTFSNFSKKLVVTDESQNKSNNLKASPTQPTTQFNETKAQANYADFLKTDLNFPTQRKLLLHQEALQLQNRPSATTKGKHLQGIDGVEGKDVLMLMEPTDDNSARVLDWPQYSNPQLRVLLQRKQNALLAATSRNQQKQKHSSPLFWPALLLSKSAQKKKSIKEKRLKTDSSYVLHLARLAVIDEQPRRALHLLQTGLISPSLLRKQSLRPQLNLIFLHALDKGFEEVCLYLLENGFPHSPFAPIFASASNPRRFPSYFLVAVALKRELLINWCLHNAGCTTTNLNKAWFNGVRPLMVAQWTGSSFGITQALLKAGAGADRSISYLTYLRCRSYFLSYASDGKDGLYGIDAMHKADKMDEMSTVNTTRYNATTITTQPTHTEQFTRIPLNLQSKSFSSSSTASSSTASSSTAPHRNRLKKLKLFSLDFACATGRFEAAHLLLSGMPDESLAQNDFCLLLLPEPSVAVALLKRCPQLLMKQRDWHGNTPLHLAARAGRLDLMSIYLRFGIQVDALNGQHATALHEAASECNRAAVQLLISHGADCSVVNGTGLTALQVARRKGISSEELIDFFHAKDTLKQTKKFLESIAFEQVPVIIEEKKPSQKRLLIQKLFSKWR